MERANRAPPTKSSPPLRAPIGIGHAIVFDGATTKYKAGQRCLWIAEDNKGVQIMRIKGGNGREGKSALSLTIYRRKRLDCSRGIRRGVRTMRITEYDRNRGRVMWAQKVIYLRILLIFFLPLPAGTSRTLSTHNLLLVMSGTELTNSTKVRVDEMLFLEGGIRLHHLAESPLGDTFPGHILHGMNTIRDLQK